MRTRSRNHGFTLVEISMVLVIIALVVGAIVVGQTLIREAQVRSILSDSEKIRAAVYAFRKKYDYWPGDFPRAESYWDTNPDGCPVTTTGTTKRTETCNGDGNGRLNAPDGGHTCASVTGSSYEQEPYRLWQHLANAGMFTGLYTGVNGSGGVLHGVPGVSVPESEKIQKVGFQLMNFDGVSNSFGWISARFTTVLFIGMEDTTTNCLEPVEPFLTAVEAHGIDIKADDGLPGTGNLRVYSDNSNLCADSVTPSSAAYVASDTSRVCSLMQLLDW